MDNRLLERIKKLLALADPTKNDSQAQVEAALAKVTQLLSENNLTMEEVTDYEKEPDITEQSVHFDNSDGTLIGKYNQWLISLVEAIAYANYCKPLFMHRGGVFIGKENDVKIAAFMLDNITYRLIKISREEMNKYMDEVSQTGIHPWRETWGRDHPRIWRREWLEGAVSGLSRKLREDRRAKEWKAYSEKNETMALLDLHNERIKGYMDKVRPDIKMINEDHIAHAEGNREAWDKGHKTGENLATQQGLEKGEYSVIAALPKTTK